MAFAVQAGKSDLIKAAVAKAAAHAFDLPVEIRTDTSGRLTLTGTAIQGFGANRFIYLNSGKRAGQETSCWDRRAKLMLNDIAAKTLKQFSKMKGILIAEIDRIAADGGPCCSRVPAAWRLE